jgi:hypothetical protein
MSTDVSTSRLPLSDAATALPGPASRGYVNSRHNSAKHNIFARDICVPGEDPADFERLLARLVQDLKPNGEYQSQLVRKIAETEWRGRRVIVAETALLTKELQSNKPNRLVQVKESPTDRRTASTSAIDSCSTCEPGEAMANVLASQPLQTLQRYEIMISRQAERLIKLFLELKKEDSIVIDVAE